jgi:hypothetical protein
MSNIAVFPDRSNNAHTSALYPLRSVQLIISLSGDGARPHIKSRQHLNTLTSGHVERRDCSPVRSWRVAHFYVFLHDPLHMRLSAGVIHLGRGHTILTSRELMW